PPAPVAALRGQQGLPGLRQSFLTRRVRQPLLRRGRCTAVSLPRVPQKLPCCNVFTVSNPDVEVRIDPRRWENPSYRRFFRNRCRGLTRRECAEIRIALHALIELTQKFATVPWVILPRILSVEKNADGDRSGRCQAIGQRPQPTVQI